MKSSLFAPYYTRRYSSQNPSSRDAALGSALGLCRSIFQVSLSSEWLIIWSIPVSILLFYASWVLKILIRKKQFHIEPACLIAKVMIAIREKRRKQKGEHLICISLTQTIQH
jgi:hypothetical protein